MIGFSNWLLSEAAAKNEVEAIIKRASQTYARGGEPALLKSMEKIFTPDFKAKFADWWQKGYYRDFDDHHMIHQGTKFYIDDANPNYYYLFAQIAKSESTVKERVNVEDYIKNGWIAYARNGDKGLGEWLNTLPEGFMPQFRRWMVDHGIRIDKSSNLYYQMFQLIKNYSHHPQTDPVPLQQGDFLHKDRLERNFGSQYHTRHTYHGYPELEKDWDDLQAKRQAEREERKKWQQGVEDDWKYEDEEEDDGRDWDNLSDEEIEKELDKEW